MAKTLAYTFMKQINGWYCGPAAVRVALTVRGVFKTQDELAASLGTTIFGTNSSSDVDRTLDQYIGQDLHKVTLIGGNDASTVQREQFRTDMKSTINSGYAVVCNVVGTVTPNDPINGGPYSYPGGHYVTVVGYDDNDNVLVADVAARVYWTTVTRMATWIAGRGYTSLRSPVAAAPVPADKSTLYLIDLASYQEGIDLVRARAAGVVIANVKTSQGISYTWSRAKEYADKARAAGMEVMSFHWLDSSADGVTQARRAFALHQQIGAVAHQCDNEDNATWQITVDYCNEFQRLLGRKVLMYSGDWWWQARGWPGSTLTPYVMAAPNDGYLGSYPGDTSPHWVAGYGGWPELSAMQFAVSPISGFNGNVSKTMIRKTAWSALSGKTVISNVEGDDVGYIIVTGTDGKKYLSNMISRRLIPEGGTVNPTATWYDHIKWWVTYMAKTTWTEAPDTASPAMLDALFGPLVGSVAPVNVDAAALAAVLAPLIKDEVTEDEIVAAVKRALREGASE